MVDRFKIAYLGAGSFRFSITFFMDICRAVELSPIHVALVDIDPVSLDIMTRGFRNMAAKAKKRNGIDITISSHTDRTEALENADFVYKSISVGLQDAEWFDNYLPLKFGIPQNTGDTVGPGGLFRNLRTNPVVAEIAKDMKKLCPKAPLLNYTNPQSGIVMSARTVAPDIQYIGLCHELFGGMKAIKAYAAKYEKIKTKKWEEFDIEYGGVNHFTWLTKLEYKGKDLYPNLRKNAHKLVISKFKRPFNFHLLEKYNYFAIPGSRHVAEFMTDYYNYFNHKIQSPYWKFPVVRDVPNLARMRKAAYWAYRQMAKGRFVPKPRHSGEKAMDMTLDWKSNTPTHHVVNIPNNHPGFGKIIPQLPEDSIVEVPAYFKDGVITPIKQINLPEEVASLVRPHAEQHRYTVNASLGNSIDNVIKAMLHDTMANWIEDDDKLEYLTKLMLFYEKQWLPDEWKEWIPSEDELKESKWWVSPKDLLKEGKMYLKVYFPPDEKLKSKAFFWKD